MEKTKKIILSLLILIIVSSILAIYVIIPSIAFLKYIPLETNSIFFIFLKHLFVLFFFVFLFFIFKKNKITNILVSVLICSYYTGIYIIIIYSFFTGGFFNPYFFLDSKKEIISTGLKIFPTSLLLVLCFCFIVFLAFSFIIIRVLYDIIDKRTNNKKLTLKTKSLIIIVLVLIFIIPPKDGYFKYHYKQIKEFQNAREYFEPYIPDYSQTQINSNENVFILQLESLNALALNGQIKDYNDIFMPNLYAIAKQGILFPYHWSNSIQTDRAMENMLCGIVNNIRASYSYQTDKINTPCLPLLLKNAGYKTISFRADDLKFHNMGEFMEKIGIDEVHSSNIMKESDKKYKWGYDDCTFYNRAFDYLENNYSNTEKLFVYFEVSSHHIPFNRKPEYSEVNKFNPTSNYLEKYLNSSLVQDHCVKEFYKRFNEFDNKNSHLFISADTSAPVGINNGNIYHHEYAYNENFLTSLVYLPPKNKTDQFYTNKITNGNTIYSHADIYPTIIELLTNQPQKNSFSFELVKNKKTSNSNYENCHILSQPYSGGAIVIIKNKNKYLYSISKKTLTYYDLQTDFFEKNPQIIEKSLGYQQFQDKYFCQRYK